MLAGSNRLEKAMAKELRKLFELDRVSKVEATETPAERRAEGRIRGVTGVILAGGESRRMGTTKALLPCRGGRFIEAIHRQLLELFEEVIVVTNTPDLYDFLPCRKVTDLHVGKGALAGIHAGLHHSSNQRIFVTACDMPYLNSSLIRELAALMGENAALVPESDSGIEPLHALYAKSALPAMDLSLSAGVRRIVDTFDRFPVRIVPASEVGCLDPAFGSFRNINTPADYYRLRDSEQNQKATLMEDPGLQSLAS